MTCPNCKRETEPALFCHFCDVYVTVPGVGTRAGVARRLAAQLLDGVSAWVILLGVLAVAGIVAAGSQSAGLSLATFFWALIAYLVFALWFLSQGKTPGKWLVGIRVVDKRQGSLPGLGRMLVRETIGKFVSGFFLGIGYFWAVFDRENQAWHDKIAGTVVVRQLGGDAAAATLSPPAVASAGIVSAVSSNPRPELQTAAAPPIQATARFCGQCGAKVQAGSRFCESCGSQET